VFLHKIVEGSASRSYGIHVAKLAGVPQQLLLAAEEKLRELEASGVSIDLDKYAERVREEELDPKAATEQISFFSFAPNPVVERLKALDLLNITPSQAFGILEELKKAAEENK
jgi:DNA mismatch repair protein MutS